MKFRHCTFSSWIDLCGKLSLFMSCLPIPFPTGTEIERVKRNFSESRPRSQLSSVAGELQGVQRIMFDNIDAVLKRGEMIDCKFSEHT